MRYELVIFDWDGTLMDSAAQIVAAMQQAIVQLGLPPRSDAALSRLIGLGLEDAFYRLYPELDEARLQELSGHYRRLYGAQPGVYGQAFPGVHEELNRLSTQRRHLAVATGKSRRGLDRALAATGWQARFQATRCADETATKPDPRMVEELLWELGVAPEQALMVGDTSYDMEMARRAGVEAVGVAWGVHAQEELHQAGASTVLAGVPGLSTWLALRED